MTPASIVDKKIGEAWHKVESLSGKILDPDRLSALEGAIYGVFAPKSKGGKIRVKPALFSALHASLSHLQGKTATKRLLVANITRVAANWSSTIADGVPIPLWAGEPIQSAIAVLSVIKDNGDRPGLQVRVKLKTGLAAGIILWFRLSETQCIQFLESQSGCHGRQCAPEEISGMQAMAVVSAKDSRHKIERLWCTQPQRAHNRKLTDLRSQIDKCPSPIPCNVCRKNVKECPLAVWAEPEK